MQKTFYKTVIFSSITLILNLLLIRFSFNFPGGEAESLLGFGDLGKLTMFTGRSIRILGILGLLGSILPLIKKFNKYVNLSFFTTSAVHFLRGPFRRPAPPLRLPGSADLKAFNIVLLRLRLVSWLGFA